MSASKSWRQGLESAKTIIDAKKSRHLTLFQQIDLTRFLDDEYIQKLNDRNELYSSSTLLASSHNDGNRIANEEEISSFWQYRIDNDKIKKTDNNENNNNNNKYINNNDTMNEIQSLSHFLISQTSNLIDGNIYESINFKRELLLERILVMLFFFRFNTK